MGGENGREGSYGALGYGKAIIEKFFCELPGAREIVISVRTTDRRNHQKIRFNSMILRFRNNRLCNTYKTNQTAPITHWDAGERQMEKKE